MEGREWKRRKIIGREEEKCLIYVDIKIIKVNGKDSLRQEEVRKREMVSRRKKQERNEVEEEN